MNAFELIHKRLYPVFKNDFETDKSFIEPIKSAEQSCDICGRPSCDWEVDQSSQSIGFKLKPSDKVVRTICQTCSIFGVGSIESLGVMIGTLDKPTGLLRFNLFKGAFLIIPIDEKKPIEFWTSGKYLTKFAPTCPFEIKDCAGGAALLALMERSEDELVIWLSPRWELWIRNLTISSKSHLVLCGETGAITVPRKKFKAFKKCYFELHPKQRSEALIVLRNEVGRTCSAKRVNEFVEENIEFSKNILNILPADPHARSVWIDACRAAK